MYQTQDRPCHECKWCRPETFVFFKSYEMARCAFPVSQPTHKRRFTEAYEGKGYCYWERHPLGFCTMKGIHWEQLVQQPISPIIAIVHAAASSAAA